MFRLEGTFDAGNETLSISNQAASRLARANKMLEVRQEELESSLDALATKRSYAVFHYGNVLQPTRSTRSEHQLEKLQKELDVKQRVKLMLEVLEQRERLRVQRIEEMTRLLKALRWV